MTSAPMMLKTVPSPFPTSTKIVKPKIATIKAITMPMMNTAPRSSCHDPHCYTGLIKYSIWILIEKKSTID